MAVTTYYSWEGDDGTHAGLARHSDDGWAVVVQAENAWAVKPELLEALIDGDVSFGEIDQQTAAGLARQYGVTLDQPPTFEWNAAKQTFAALAAT